MWRLGRPEIAHITTSWRREFAAHIDAREFRLSGLLDWNDVRSMDGDGFEFGSHSKSHSMLSSLDEPAVREELEGSKARLEQELGHAVMTIAYPFGKDCAHSPLVRKLATQAGYRLAAAYTSGANWLGDGLNAFALRRQNIERQHGKRRFRALVEFPEWIHW